jgi:hypothetical protein
MRSGLIWIGFLTVLCVPVLPAIWSPLLAWRDPIYILAGFAGIVALVLMFAQPILAAGYLPGLDIRKSRGFHRATGAILLVLVIAHVGGLWITSPPDVIDALLFASPTPFSIWGVAAMWALFAAALTVAMRRRLRMSPRTSQRIHTGFVLTTVLGSVLHTLLIVGTMETFTKIVLCLLVIAAAVKVAHARFKARSG